MPSDRRMAEVSDAQYRYYPSQERLVDVSNYLINPDHASPSPDNVRRRRKMARNPESHRGPSAAEGDFDLRNASWSTQLLSASDLLGLRLPVIVKVVCGYDGGESGLRLNPEQIVQVSGFTKQMRVVATDSSSDRTFTFPADQSLTLRVLDDSRNPDGGTQSLSEVLNRLSLPVDVEVIDDVMSKNSSSSSCSVQQFPETRMTLRGGIEEHRFLICNPIVNGWLQQTVTLVPEQLPVQFRLATGTKHTTAEEWMDIRGMYCRAVRHLKFHLIDGYSGIVYDDWIPQETPLASTQSHNSGSDRERNDDDDDDDDDDDLSGDSESTSKRTRCQLLWQQTVLSQGSLPSLPTAVVESTGRGTDRARSGSSSPSPRLSAESLLLLQPSKSTESLLPRRSVDSGNASSKRKSNVPSRLRRRKGGEARKQAALADPSGAESVDRQGANGSDLQPRSRDRLPAKSDAKTEKDIGYSDVITETQAIDKRQKSDCDVISTSPIIEPDRCAALRPNHSPAEIHGRPCPASRDHVRTPIYWTASDLCIDGGEASSGSDPDLGRARMTRWKAGMLRSTPAAAASRRSHSLGVMSFDEGGGLQSWPSSLSCGGRSQPPPPPPPSVWPSPPAAQSSHRMLTNNSGGSDVIDDGYGTESVSTKQSSNALTMTSQKRERVFYI